MLIITSLVTVHRAAVTVMLSEHQKATTWSGKLVASKKLPVADGGGLSICLRLSNLPNVVNKTHLHPSHISGYVFVTVRFWPTQAYVEVLCFGM
jgi:hypothetical protein